jgi:hypothetical protein
LTPGAVAAVGLQLGPIIAQVKAILVADGIGFAAGIPEIDRTIVIARSDSIAKAQVAYVAAVAFGSWLPWIALLCLLAGIAIGRRRVLVALWAAIALALSMGLVLLGIPVGEAVFVASVSPTYLPGDVAGTVYEEILALVASTAVATGVLAVTVAVVLWLAGPFALPRAGRTLVRRGSTALRRWAARSGFSTGRFGRRLYRLRHVVQAVLAGIGVAVIVLNRPLSPSLVIGTAVWIAVALVVLEIVQIPDDETAAETPDETVAPAGVGGAPAAPLETPVRPSSFFPDDAGPGIRR